MSNVGYMTCLLLVVAKLVKVLHFIRAKVDHGLNIFELGLEVESHDTCSAAP